MQRVVCVDPDGARAEGIRNLDSGGEASGVQRSGKAISGAVCDVDDLGLVLELCDCTDGTEDFFLLDLHVFRDVGEDGGLDEEAFFAFALAPGFYSCALFLTLFNIALEVVSGLLDGWGGGVVGAYLMMRSN